MPAWPFGRATIPVASVLRVLILDGDPRNLRRDDEAYYVETALRPGERLREVHATALRSGLTVQDVRNLDRVVLGHAHHLRTAVGREALELARAQPFDLALIDLRLPDGNGIDFCALKSVHTVLAPPSA